MQRAALENVREAVGVVEQGMLLEGQTVNIFPKDRPDQNYKQTLFEEHSVSNTDTIHFFCRTSEPVGLKVMA